MIALNVLIYQVIYRKFLFYPALQALGFFNTTSAYFKGHPELAAVFCLAVKN